MTESMLDLKWARADPKASVEQLYTTKSIHRITPISPYTLPTLCLMKHLASGKPVALSLASDYNTQHDHQVTHLMLQHGNDVYLHVLSLNRSFTPWLTMPRMEEDETEYRICEFGNLARQHILRVPTNSNVEDTSSYFTLMKHAQFIYNVPTAIERQTRIFPICVEKDSILFIRDSQRQFPTLHMRILTPLLSILSHRPSGEQLSEEGKYESYLTKYFQYKNYRIFCSQ